MFGGPWKCLLGKESWKGMEVMENQIKLISDSCFDQ